MDLGDLLLYLARGALTAFEVVLEQLSRSDLKALRYISSEVSDMLVPYLFDNSNEIYISAYGPDLDVAQAVLSNYLLRHRVRKLVWDYSVLDHELLRYAWYDECGRKVVGDEWQGLCSFICDHTHILAHEFDVDALERALSSLPNLADVHVTNCNFYGTTSSTKITLLRKTSSAKSPTTAMWGTRPYSINLLEPSPPLLRPYVGHRRMFALSPDLKAESGRFQNLIYKGCSEVLDCCRWVFRASADRITPLLIAMAQAPDLQLKTVIVSSSKGCECGKVQAWARAFRNCPQETLAAWASKFACIERLHLFMDDGGHIETHTIDRHYLQRSFGPVLRAAYNLEDLQISGVEWNVIDMLRGTYPQLRRLFIDIANLESQSLTDFCRRHTVSLQVLEIRNSQLNGGSWQQFLIDITEGTVFPLSEVSFHALSVMNGRKLNIRLRKIFEDVNLQYQGAQCILEKSFIALNQTMKLRLQYERGDILLKSLVLRQHLPLGMRCRIHGDDKGSYIWLGARDSWWWTSYDLLDYE